MAAFWGLTAPHLAGASLYQPGQTLNPDCAPGSPNCGVVVTASSTTFLASGAGAVSRTVQDKLGDTVTVKDFGAKGDGVTDDTAAIQSAINSLTTGGIVVFPGNTATYCISDNLTITASHFTIEGPGQLKVCTNFSNVPTGYTSYPMSTVPAMINILGQPNSHVTDITIRGLRFYGYATTPAGSEPKAISSSQADDVSIENNYFTHFGDEVIWPAGSPNGSGWKILNNTIDNTGNTNSIASAIVLNLDNSIASNNVLNNNYSAIGSNGDNNTITNNTVNGFQESGIGVGGNGLITNTVVSGNNISATVGALVAGYRGIVVAHDARNTLVSGNSIRLSVTSSSTSPGATAIYLNHAANGCQVIDNKAFLDLGGALGGSGASGIVGFGNGFNCNLTNNNVTVTNENVGVSMQGIQIATTGNADAMTVALRNNYVEGLSRTGPGARYAFDLNTNAGGTVQYTTASDQGSGGYFRFSSTLISDSAYDDVPLYSGTPFYIQGIAGNNNMFVVASSSGAQLFTITSSGSTGIGTTSPQGALHIYNGSGGPSSIIQDNTAALRFIPSGSYNYIQSGATLTADSRADLRFTSMFASSTFMTIQGSTGNVGIGTTGPGQKLEVNGSIGFTGQNGIIGNAGVNDMYSSVHFHTGYGVWIRDEVNKVRGMDQSGGDSYNLGVFVDSAEKVTITIAGNVGIGTTTPTLGPLVMASGAYVTTGGTWTNASDRNLKENFTTMSPADILQKIDALPITQWNYKAEDPSITHIGPVAQDFYAAFDLGGQAGKTSISTIDPAGVALLGIKALNQKIAALQGSLTGNAMATSLSVYVPANFSGDSVGEARILAGQTSVRVTFKQTYAQQPIVTITPEDFLEGLQYRVTGKEDTGFMIELNATTTADLTFDWHSFDSPESRLTVSDGTSEPIALVVAATPPAESAPVISVVSPNSLPANDSATTSTTTLASDSAPASEPAVISEIATSTPSTDAATSTPEVDAATSTEIVVPPSDSTPATETVTSNTPTDSPAPVDAVTSSPQTSEASVTP
jgi:hypothetical protein